MVKDNPTNLSRGFTIVELLVVISIIGILALISFVSYTGISQRAIASVLQSELTNASLQLRLYQTEHGNYPASLDASNCPVGPVDTTYCLKASTGTTYQYAANNISSPQGYCLVATNGAQIYSVAHNSVVVAGGINLLTGDSSIEKTSLDEFLRYADVAPIIDGYGMRQYTISFDIKSANISVQNSFKLYMQNGNGARYIFAAVFVPVTTSYSRQSVTIIPTYADVGRTQSYLAYYGIYGSGNKPTVKNFKIEIGNTATAWTMAP